MTYFYGADEQHELNGFGLKKIGKKLKKVGKGALKGAAKGAFIGGGTGLLIGAAGAALKKKKKKKNSADYVVPALTAAAPQVLPQVIPGTDPVETLIPQTASLMPAEPGFNPVEAVAPILQLMAAKGASENQAMAAALERLQQAGVQPTQTQVREIQMQAAQETGGDQKTLLLALGGLALLAVLLSRSNR